MPDQKRVYPVILSGGVGARLWPLSRANMPKQLLALTGSNSLLLDTALRFSDRGQFHPPMLIANSEHRFIIAEQMHGAGIVDACIVLEPVGRNTAPAAAVAALMIQEYDPEGIMMVLPSDHSVHGQSLFADSIRTAVKVAEQGYLVAFGIVPNRPSTEYGYIRRGEPITDAADVCGIEKFVEKPDAETARSFIDSGEYAWNSGMFMFPVARYIDELNDLAPEMLVACRAAVAKSHRDLDFVRLDDAAFSDCPSNSIDYAVMEKTKHGAIISVEFGWSDVGAWDALWHLADKDESGNSLLGDVTIEDVSRSYIRSDGPQMIAAIGLRDACIVAAGDSVFVAPLDRAHEVKAIVERLKNEGRHEVIGHPRVLRPWGSFTDIERGPRFKVKRLTVKPGGRLSLQTHKHRAEHWVVVEGVATVTRDNDEMTLEPDQSTYIMPGMVHRLENKGDQDLHLIEIQVGDYLEEDDIVRLEDDYKRD